MICEDCRKAATMARIILNAGSNIGMGALFGANAMGRHKKCKGGTWCECHHDVPAVRNA